jgi:CRISPR-associated protein Cmr3
MKSKFEYQIKLRPLTKYFFGGEKYYDEQDSVFYFERSREFPQQTTILGVMRYQLLLENSLISLGSHGAHIGKGDRATAAELIGETSFDGEVTSFGKITYLSPVTIIDGDGNHWINYPNAKLENGEYANLDVEFLNDCKLSLHSDNEIRNKIPVFKNFNHKKGIEYGFAQVNDMQNFLPRSTVFSEKIKNEEQIGIYKAYRKKGVVSETEEKGFYKYQYCHINEGFAFSCFVEMDREITEKKSIVRLGKERTAFELEVSEVENPFTNEEITPGSQVLLISDAYLTGDWSQYCKTAVCDIIPFNNLQYNLKNSDNYSNTPTKGKKRLNLLQRGSLLWTSDKQDDASKLEKMFTSKQAFTAIGYNHYRVIKNEKQ